MIAVLFEAWPAPEHRETYLGLAADLRPHLASMEGFISIERFESLAEPGKLLSLSFWRDEEAVAAWRRFEAHRAAQAQGRGGIFQDYRLRVATVLRDYGARSREEAPADSQDWVRVKSPLPPADPSSG